MIPEIIKNILEHSGIFGERVKFFFLFTKVHQSPFMDTIFSVHEK